MDVVTISTAVVSTLLHALPHLTDTVGESATKAIGSEVGKQGFELAKKLWSYLWPKMEGNAAAVEAVRDAASNPADKDNEASLRKEIRKLLEKDDALLKELASLLQEGNPTATYQATNTGSGAIAQGNKAVAGGVGGLVIGGNVTGNINLSKSDEN